MRTLDLHETAAFLELHPQTVRRLARTGALPAAKPGRRWCAERAYKASLPDDVSHLRWLHPHLFDRHLDEIDRDVIDDVRLARIAPGRANATVNHTLQVIRGILRTAMREWGWLDAVPYVRMMPEQTRRVRWLSREEADQLLEALPIQIAEMMRFTLATGLRERNVYAHLRHVFTELPRAQTVESIETLLPGSRAR